MHVVGICIQRTRYHSISFVNLPSDSNKSRLQSKSHRGISMQAIHNHSVLDARKSYIPKRLFFENKSSIIAFAVMKRQRHIDCWLLLLSTTLSERLISNWARHRLVAASSRRTEEKVASLNGSGRHWRRASRARALSLNLLLCQCEAPGAFKVRELHTSRSI